MVTALSGSFAVRFRMSSCWENLEVGRDGTGWCWWENIPQLLRLVCWTWLEGGKRLDLGIFGQSETVLAKIWAWPPWGSEKPHGFKEPHQPKRPLTALSSILISSRLDQTPKTRSCTPNSGYRELGNESIFWKQGIVCECSWQGSSVGRSG